MLKFVDTKVVFSEIPDEITLAINISGCPCHCRGCHSLYLWHDIGECLTENSLLKLIKKNNGITCVSIMGGDSNPEYVDYLSSVIKSLNLKSAWYSGRDKISSKINISNFDYIKIGSYIEGRGPLSDKNTNQRFYLVDESGKLVDYTHKFQNKYHNRIY
ncbi:anaerobic ribonucleoside-triphosphate reductase activating protein [Bacteroides sp. 224]|uniref:anaerobic ribonucleoside-triphosphate reductase activating protein n=1 Tax=Bacteroides sp. 224 TaxID=2302936 RepID=UPI0013D3E30E|nr:anaerobic ribonucleoside-triphosphate reductase activating protein [Bacteroides sp. 224]NDV63929.1 anaerobic ribonucleoside-triphosphate reductase activating protein [Bacteroides sp. 224]